MRDVVADLLGYLCTALDRIPRYSEGRWYGWGDWGCQLGIARFGSRLADRGSSRD